MTSPIQQNILKALYAMMKPLARMLLRSGIGFREFAEVAKTAFVYEASVGYGIRGRETNMSRVAIMTGLSRREVRKLREQHIDNLLLSNAMFSPGGVVLAQWHLDERFADPGKGPRTLEYDSGPYSFADLVRLFAGDIPPGAMKTELKRIGAIEEGHEGELRVLKRTYIPNDIDAKVAMALKTSVLPLLETIAHNCNLKSNSPLFFERTASVKNIPEKQSSAVRSYLRNEMSSFFYTMDEYLERNSKVENEMQDSPSTTTGVGIFYYETKEDIW